MVLQRPFDRLQKIFHQLFLSSFRILAAVHVFRRNFLLFHRRPNLRILPAVDVIFISRATGLNLLRIFLQPRKNRRILPRQIFAQKVAVTAQTLADDQIIHVAVLQHCLDVKKNLAVVRRFDMKIFRNPNFPRKAAVKFFQRAEDFVLSNERVAPALLFDENAVTFKFPRPAGRTQSYTDFRFFTFALNKFLRLENHGKNFLAVARHQQNVQLQTRSRTDRIAKKRAPALGNVIGVVQKAQLVQPPTDKLDQIIIVTAGRFFRPQTKFLAKLLDGEISNALQTQNAQLKNIQHVRRIRLARQKNFVAVELQKIIALRQRRYLRKTIPVQIVPEQAQQLHVSRHR